MERDETPKEGKRRDKPLSALQRLIAGVIADDLPLGSTDDPCTDSCPNVWQWLSVTAAGKGHVMPPGNITLQLVPGGVLAILKHPGLCKQVEASADTLGNALVALESVLTGPCPAIKTLGRGEPKVKKRKTIG